MPELPVKSAIEEASGKELSMLTNWVDSTIRVCAEPTDFADQFYRRMGYRAYNPAEISEAKTHEIPPSEAVHLTATMDWIYNFIMQPHPNLGRNGAVCPYVKSSIEASIFYVCMPPMAQNFEYEDVFDALLKLGGVFDYMVPQTGQNAALRALLVLFPQATDAMLSHPQKSKLLKTEMMRRGVTVGQFFPTEHADSLLKAKFFPVQPPLCLYTMRPFIESDWMFIQGEREWRDVYKARFGSAGQHLGKKP